MDPMKFLLEPHSIAIIGASASEGKSSHILLENLIHNEYQGRIYLVNPNASEILGYTVYPTIVSVPDEIDLALLVVPGQYVKEMLEQCIQKRVKSAVIISAGFGETGDEGSRNQAELADLINKSGVRCIGPNTIGLVNKQKNLMASFVSFRKWLDGPVAIGAQSGIFAGALAAELMEMETQNFGICKSVSFGNMIDLDETDFLSYLGQDSACKVIGFHLERINRPRSFLSLANKIKSDKPIIVLKTGRTDYGAKAALSHTGSLAMKDALVDSSFKQYGIIRTYTLEEFLATLKAFAYQPLPRGNKIGVLTFAGASGVMASDEISESGLSLANFDERTLKKVKTLMPPWQPVHNPLDIWVALGANRNEKVYEQSINSILDDENVDILLCLLLGLPNSDITGIRDILANAIQLHSQKPVFLVIIGGEVKERWMRELEGLNVPIYSETSLAIKVIKSMYVYQTIRNQESRDPL
jgi:acyl-CoA synthetase (NDP forming)